MWPQTGGDIQGMCPEVEKACCVMSQSGKIKHGNQVVDEGELTSTIMMTDSTFFSVFDFELVQGDKRSALDSPDKCIITEQLAKRLFGNKNPIGESLQITGERHVFLGQEDPYDSTLVYTISAIAKDFDRTVLPNETQIIASMERFPQVMGYKLSNDAFACLQQGRGAVIVGVGRTSGCCGSGHVQHRFTVAAKGVGQAGEACNVSAKHGIRGRDYAAAEP